MNWVDGIVLFVIAVSALLAFLRGIVREGLGLAAWAGAIWLAVQATPWLAPTARRWLGSAEAAEPVAFAVAFLAALLVASIAAGLLARSIRAGDVGGLDRTFGFLFGALRGAALVSCAYLLVGLVFAPKLWPDIVLRARSLPYAYVGARFIAHQLPSRYAPGVEPPPGRGQTDPAPLTAPPGTAPDRKPGGEDDP